MRTSRWSVALATAVLLAALGVAVPAQAATPAVVYYPGDAYTYIYYNAYTDNGVQKADDFESQALTVNKKINDTQVSAWGSASASTKATSTITLGSGNSTDGFELKKVTASGTVTGQSTLTDPEGQ